MSSKLPTATMRPSCTATAVASGNAGSKVRINAAV